MDFQVLVGRLELEAQNLRETIAVSQHKLNEIETFLKLGQRFTGLTEAEATPAELMNVMLGATQRDRVLDAAERVLADGRRRTTRELLSELEGFGVVPGGLDPAPSLSTYLSRDKRFSSDVRRGGWTLASLANRDDEFEKGAALTLAGLARYGGTAEPTVHAGTLTPLAHHLTYATAPKKNRGS